MTIIRNGPTEQISHHFFLVHKYVNGIKKVLEITFDRSFRVYVIGCSAMSAHHRCRQYNMYSPIIPSIAVSLNSTGTTGILSPKALLY